ncbi:MAG: hypothetical protein ABSC19_08005 [Syntrophorhabdales bacterium]|jgi:hypothetical protein
MKKGSTVVLTALILLFGALSGAHATIYTYGALGYPGDSSRIRAYGMNDEGATTGSDRMYQDADRDYGTHGFFPRGTTHTPPFSYYPGFPGDWGHDLHDGHGIAWWDHHDHGFQGGGTTTSATPTPSAVLLFAPGLAALVAVRKGLKKQA